MASICVPCSTDNITTYPIPCKKIEATRKGGIQSLLMLKCDETITDLTDDTEWTALKTANKLIVTPLGMGDLIEPETQDEQLDSCSPAVVIDETMGINFNTKLFDNTTYLDFQTEFDIKNLYSSYTLLFIGCDGLLYYNRDWVSGDNPGFYNWSPKVSRISAPNALQILNINVKFKTFGTGLKGIQLPQDVLDAIYA
jgi:hypothetical protein